MCSPPRRPRTGSLLIIRASTAGPDNARGKRENGLERHVLIDAAIEQVLHMAPSGAIELLKQGIAPAIEFEHVHAEAMTKGSIEGRRRLHPVAVDIEVGVGVPVKNVGAERFVKARRCHVVADVGIAHAGRHAGGPRHGGKQRGLADAVSPARRKHLARAVACRVRDIDIRIIDHPLADGFVKRDRPPNLVVRARCRRASELANVCSVAIDEFGRIEILRFGRFQHVLRDPMLAWLPPREVSYPALRARQPRLR
jgi:hypothetical protein